MRCPPCPRFRPPVPGSGPTPARILFLGEAPSYQEDKYGAVFVGKTGEELVQTYLPLAFIHRDSVYIDNVFSCSHIDYHNPEPEEALSCISLRLSDLLNRVRPQIICPMGSIACSIFPEIGPLTLQHGIPLPGKWGAWRGVLFPMFHPSSGIHVVSFMIPLMADFKRLGELSREMEGLWRP